MEIVASDVDSRHLGVGDDDALWIEVVVDLAADGEACLCGGCGNQIDDDAIADERLGAPVLTDEGEQAVLDLVPLAGARRQVVDDDVDAELVGQLLQLALPQAQARSIAAATIGGEPHPRRPWVGGAPRGLPPPAAALDAGS